MRLTVELLWPFYLLGNNTNQRKELTRLLYLPCKERVISTIKQFATFFLVLLFLSLFFLGNKTSEFSDVPEAFLDDFKLLQVILSQNKHDESLIKIETLLKQSQKFKQQTLAWLYEKKAEIHADKYHFHFAIDALNRAKNLSQQKNNYQQRINHFTDYIESTQKERKLRTTYRDGRNTGIARTLQNKVTIIYFYLNDNRWSKWSNKDRLENSTNVKLVTDWYKQQAKIYNISNLSFNTRYFFLRSPKGLGKEWIRKREFFDYASSLFANQLGYNSLNDFVDTIRRKNPDNEVAIVFHSNAKARSFAASCLKVKNSNCKLEYVMLTKKMGKHANDWTTTQTQSHEILHLFGAADLYNIEGAKNYAVTDLMNYYSKELKYASISPLTAWSIGWDELPHTPFIVNEIKE